MTIWMLTLATALVGGGSLVYTGPERYATQAECVGVGMFIKDTMRNAEGIVSIETSCKKVLLSQSMAPPESDATATGRAVDITNRGKWPYHDLAKKP